MVFHCQKLLRDIALTFYLDLEFLMRKIIKFNKNDHRFYWDLKQIKLWIKYINKVKQTKTIESKKDYAPPGAHHGALGP